ncbi:hypothetical protein tinsulaeT_23500 [Thalassotalea insulae]|uniref:histidine kinase n=1 Tax=Thalassotalea insulae TaxID=2056778 RepID=A0ABQ6GWB5_9GAMM|nr:CHASE domain-containing protein [Thalassotalea insulae]GLX79010.1 hypothetical protein tinsulaeT_23500 [Thalassotalea insulae]
MQKVLVTLMAFCTYFLLVQFGHLFTIPFGFASPIWPVSGVILGLYLRFGAPVLIGAFASALISFHQDSFIAALPFYVISWLSVISVLQFMLAKLLAQRFCVLPINTHLPSEIVKFLLLTGPVAVLITSLMSIFTLAFSVPIETEVLLYIGAVKWIGDFMSIVFITPVILFVTTNSFVKKARHSAASTLASLFSLSLISVIFLLSNQSFQQKKMQQFVNATEPFIDHVEYVQNSIKQNLHALDGLYQASESVTRDEFRLFSENIKNPNIEIQGIGWLPLIHHSERQAFEKSLSELNFPVSTIQALTQSGFSVAPKQPLYMPIFFIEPIEQNKSALGLDVASHPIVKASVDKAISIRSYVISPLLSLVQQQDKFSGVVVYYPIYKQINSANKQQFIGLVEVVFELDLLLSNYYRQAEIKHFSFSFTYGKDNSFTHQDFNPEAIFTHSAELALFDKHGKLYFTSSASFERELTDWFSLSMMLVGCLLGVICVMFVFFIITFNHSLSRKVKESTAKLTSKNEELMMANQAKNLFLANISHEYRTPLNAIIGFAEIAQRETHDMNTKEYLAKIRHSSDVLLNIVNDVLDISKIQAGELKLEQRPFQPSVVTLSVIEMLLDKAKEKSICLEHSFSPEFSLWVSGDETRFKQTFINLLNNAIKFTHQGRISIKGEAQKIADNTCKLTIVVADTGIGISDENQQRIFTPFAQAEASTTRQFGGTGIGLSIVKQLCLMMDGDIHVTSQLGEGSTFTVNLKLPCVQAPEKSLASNDVTFQAAHILVVEDNKINQLIVKKQLAPLGVSCVFANDGEQALSYLSTACPDLILMDLQMPNMDGFTASAIIKKNPSWQQIPIVILSASVGKQDKAKAAELGINDFIHKPFQQADLITILSKYLRQSEVANPSLNIEQESIN